MGITTDNFFENIYKLIFTPKSFFNNENCCISVRLAVCIVIFVTVFTKTASAVFSSSINSWFWFLFSIFVSVIAVLFVWFITALFFEYVAKIFDRNGSLNKLLFYSAYALIPYIFFAPLNLLKNIGVYGYILGSTMEFLLYLWIIFLFALALSAVYKITISRGFMLIFLPICALFFSVYWIICFFTKICYIFSI